MIIAIGADQVYLAALCLIPLIVLLTYKTWLARLRKSPKIAVYAIVTVALTIIAKGLVQDEYRESPAASPVQSVSKGSARKASSEPLPAVTH